ncbi:glycosyltransferase family 39 protein [Hymenobacter sp. 15J16-1T3B]|uniref:glycosyltransferase family 39 protein n=1 Tax=Hymenobacter sp. 15J16-1T3B TaxID=2886941 RepID=UPI001D11ED30|nr:glycosyltransferase family 39 protein [Hymenobacter sp. 15J16-1T3B]MCC3156956.1 glycosyltransferase family 39 protein [Hymenobacter sp. 15J16-1T3B]
MPVLSLKVSAPAMPRPAAPAAAPRLAAERTARWSRLLYLVLALGIALRLVHFFYSRSFVTDELYLGVNIIKKGYWALATEPFEYQQKAPIGYLWAVKSLALVFGYGEKSLRLFSLLAGIASLLVLVPVARYFLKPWTVVVAVAIMAFSSACVFHSIEAKQYATELLAAVVAVWLYTRYRARTDVGSLLLWGLLGSALLWFSFSLIFVLAGIGIGLSVHALARRQWRTLLLYAIPFGLWVLSFGAQYLLITSKYHESGWLIDYFDRMDQAFMPMPPSVASAKWLAHKVYLTLLHPLSLMLDLDGNLDVLNQHPLRYVFKMGWLHLSCLVIGAVYFARKDRLNFAVLLLPMALAVAASAVKVYPFHERFTLFLLPALIIVISLGVEWLQRRLARRPAWFGLLLALFFAPTVITSAREAADPRLAMHTEYSREAIMYVNEHYRPGDAVYVFWNMNQSYEYYQLAYPLKYTAVTGSFVKNEASGPADYLRRLQPDFDRLKGARRLWLVYDNQNRNAIGDYVTLPEWYHREDFSPPGLLHAYFGTLGKKTQQVQYNRNTVALYELQPTPAPSPRPMLRPKTATRLPAQH